MDEMFEGVPLTEAERTAYSRAFDAVCRLDEAKATAERLRVAAGRTTGLERDSNVWQAKEAEAEVSRLEAALRGEEIAASPERPVSEQEAEPKADVPRTTCDDWMVQARTIADELNAIDHKGGAHDSLRGIADRVAKCMRGRCQPEAMIRTTDGEVCRLGDRVTQTALLPSDGMDATEVKPSPNALAHAMDAGLIAYRKLHGTTPTARALFDWLGEHDKTGTIIGVDEATDKITWKRADGGLKDTAFKSFQNRFTGLIRK